MNTETDENEDVETGMEISPHKDKTEQDTVEGEIEAAKKSKPAAQEDRNLVDILYRGDATVTNYLAPAAPGKHKWHPTHATIVAEDGTTYEWNARAHRKMRYPQDKAEQHPKLFRERFRLFCWEPHIVTWHICWIGVIANTMWVVNGLYATWPGQAFNSDPGLISYATGVVGAFLFIITGYLGYVEAINQTHADVKLPVSHKKERDQRQFERPESFYGHCQSPIAHEGHGVLESKEEQEKLLSRGHPLVLDKSTNKFITKQMFRHFVEEYGDETEAALVGRHWDVRVGNQIFKLVVEGWSEVVQGKTTAESKKAEEDANNEEKNLTLHELSEPKPSDAGYRWWAEPDFHYIGILNAYVFFISTIIFFIPAAIWLTMDRNEAPVAATIFWVYILQMIASIGFVFVGHSSMAEAAGSWTKPKFNYIGYWIAVCNTIGGYGFLLYAVLAVPSVVNESSSEALLKWGADLATFWGSCFFELAGLLACVEFASQHPITVSK